MRPSCPTSSATAQRRNVGYYESWSSQRGCQAVQPEDLNLNYFTSINLAFSYFDSNTFQITPSDSNEGSLYSRFTALKQKKTGLQTWISIGGWSFTDPPTAGSFSKMVSTQANRQAFVNNAVAFMKQYGFDGMDIDWEYPGESDRGGTSADKANLVSPLQ